MYTIKHFYAARSNYGVLLQKGYTEFFQFDSKKERDNWVHENDMNDGNVNHRAFVVTYKELYDTIGKTVDGAKVFDGLRSYNGYGELMIMNFWGLWLLADSYI